MRIRTVWTAVAAGVFALGMASASWADKKPEDPTEKRFQSVEKQLRQLREIILQARDTGQPVQVRVSNEPDPELATLQQRVDDLEQAARTRNDQIDGIAHDLDLAKKSAASLETELKGVEDRISRLDAAMKAAQAAQAAAPPPDANASLGLAPSPSAPPPQQQAGASAAGADQAFRQARQLLLQGQYPAASDAFQGFVETYGDSPRGPEARYWLGETLFIRGLYPDAAAAYIGAIRGWPQTTWAPDAVVKLARTLVALNKPTDACRALVEFTRRYPDAATPAKTRAQSVRAAAKCTA